MAVLPVLMRALTLMSLSSWAGVKFGGACRDWERPLLFAGWWDEEEGGAIGSGMLPEVLRR